VLGPARPHRPACAGDRDGAGDVSLDHLRRANRASRACHALHASHSPIAARAGRLRPRYHGGQRTKHSKGWRLMTRLLPFPILSCGLLVLWLLLNQTIALGQFLIGCVLAFVCGLILTTLQLPRERVRRPSAVLRLFALVTVDIIRSNIAVGRIILGLGRRQRTSGFVNIPLDLRNPYALAVLA